MEQRVTFRNIFDTKHKAGEILFQNKELSTSMIVLFPITATKEVRGT